MRGIRGATRAAADTPEAILTATRELLECMLAANALDLDDVVSIFFSATPDLTSTFPAGAARDLGWTDIPLMCMTEIAVRGALGHCIRVLMHVETTLPREAIVHVYQGGAESLRPDLTPRPATSMNQHAGTGLQADLRAEAPA